MCLIIDIGFSITAEDVINKLEECFILLGKTKIIRTDNRSSEFRSREFDKFFARNRIKHEFINKGSPLENGNIESFIGKFREECLNLHEFNNLKEMKK